MFQKLIRTDDDVASLVLRLTLAIVFFPHGAQKVLGWWGGGGFSATMSYFTGDGMPWLIAFLVVMGEFLGPLGLAVGFLSRFAAFGLGVIMVGAIFMAHASHGFFMNWYGNQEGEGFEYHLLAIGIAIAVMLKGSGPFSIDRQLSE
ncbi:MAG: DoxX family protein [Acidobacteriota bacterium]